MGLGTMRDARAERFGLAVVVSLLALASRAEGAPGKQQDDRKWCVMCHRGAAYGQLTSSIHAKLQCRDCHEGYHLNPHEPVVEPSGDFSNIAPFAKTDRVALAACSGCHEDVGTPTELMLHGKADGGLQRPAPYCLDCHGEPHQIRKADTLPDNERRLAQNAACTTCHGNPARMSLDGGTPTIGIEPAETYADSIHNRKLVLGSLRAPGCVDCHGGHNPIALKEAPEKACAHCHEGAGAEFASVVTHEPVNAIKRPVAFYTQKFFGWLTFLTIAGLLVHVALDVTQSLGGRRGSRNGSKKG